MAEQWSGVKAPQIDHETMLKLARGARIGELIPYAVEVAEKAIAQETTRVFKKMDDGTLTPQEARDAWGVVYGYRKVLLRFEKFAKEAQALGDQLNEEMNDG